MWCFAGNFDAYAMQRTEYDIFLCFLLVSALEQWFLCWNLFRETKKIICCFLHFRVMRSSSTVQELEQTGWQDILWPVTVFYSMLVFPFVCPQHNLFILFRLFFLHCCRPVLRNFQCERIWNLVLCGSFSCTKGFISATDTHLRLTVLYCVSDFSPLCFILYHLLVAKRKMGKLFKEEIVTVSVGLLWRWISNEGYSAYLLLLLIRSTQRPWSEQQDPSRFTIHCLAVSVWLNSTSAGKLKAERGFLEDFNCLLVAIVALNGLVIST